MVMDYEEDYEDDYEDDDPCHNCGGRGSPMCWDCLYYKKPPDIPLPGFLEVFIHLFIVLLISFPVLVVITFVIMWFSGLEFSFPMFVAIFLVTTFGLIMLLDLVFL